MYEKEKRRIKRFLTTGKKQARVHPTQERDVIEYKTKHYVTSLFFKKDKLNRLRLHK
jgi:hypothetical protein